MLYAPEFSTCSNPGCVRSPPLRRFEGLGTLIQGLFGMYQTPLRFLWISPMTESSFETKIVPPSCRDGQAPARFSPDLRDSKTQSKNPKPLASPISTSFNGLQQMLPPTFETSTCLGPNATTPCSPLYEQPRDGRTPRLARSDAGSAASTDCRLRYGSSRPKYEESSGATIDRFGFLSHQQCVVNVTFWGFGSQVDVMWGIRIFTYVYVYPTPESISGWWSLVQLLENVPAKQIFMCHHLSICVS